MSEVSIANQKIETAKKCIEEALALLKTASRCIDDALDEPSSKMYSIQYTTAVTTVVNDLFNIRQSLTVTKYKL